MAKSLLYATNTSSQTVSAGSTVALGSTSRKIGCGINLSNNTITFTQPGFYDIDVNATYTGTAGNVILNVLQNGTAIAGATSTETIGTASTEIHSASINTTIRIYCCLASTITVGVASTATSTPTFSNFAIRVTKI